MSALYDVTTAAFERYPRLGKRALNHVIPRVLPVTRGLGLSVVELDDEGAELRLPFGRVARNHVGGLYLGVLLIAAEVSMAIYVMRLCRPDRFSTLVRGTRSEFWKQGREPVVAVCRPPPDLRERIVGSQGLAPREKVGLEVEVDVLFAESREPMGKVHFDISIWRRP